MKRHNARIIAVQVLYNMDISKLMPNEVEDALNNLLAMEAEEEYPVEIDSEYAREICLGVVAHLSEIDAIIINSLTNYTLDRLSYVDRAIVRVSLYEMKWLEVDKRVAIDEALEITKDYSCVDNDAQVKFNNKLLDNITKKIYDK